jgi:hypothetical protein
MPPDQRVPLLLTIGERLAILTLTNLWQGLLPVVALVYDG